MADERLTARLKQAVAQRAQNCCEYCRSQARFAVQGFSVEHVEPHSGAGETVPENLALACQGCNNHKYKKTQGRDPATGILVPLFHPRNQRWRDHFTWNDDATLVLGLT